MTQIVIFYRVSRTGWGWGQKLSLCSSLHWKQPIHKSEWL